MNNRVFNAPPVSSSLQACLGVAYSGDVNGGFQRDVDSRSGDVNKVGAQRRWKLQ